MTWYHPASNIGFYPAFNMGGQPSNDGGGIGGIGLINSGALTDLATFTRASSATLLTDPSTLAEVADNIPRFSYNSVYGSRRYLHEGARTNSIRNNTMQGASAPSTLPTNWSVVVSRGLTTAVSAVSSVDGKEYIRLQISGTPSSTGNYQLAFESSSQIVASNGQTWTESFFLALAAGALTNINSIAIGINENTSGGGFVAGGSSPDLKGSLTSSLARFELTRTLSGGGTVARVYPLLNMSVTSGNAVDVTLDIALPQMELGSFATSPIKTTNAAVARAVEVNTTPLGAWFNPNEGTFVVDFTYTGWANNFQTILGVSSGVNNNGIYLRVRGSGTEALELASFTSGSATVGISLANPSVINTRYHVAFRYKLNDFAAVANGGSVTTDTSATVPTVTNIHVGDSGAGDRNGFCQISDCFYLPYAAPNAQLQALSTL